MCEILCGKFFNTQSKILHEINVVSEQIDFIQKLEFL